MTPTETDEKSQPLRSITFRLSLQDVQMLAARPEPLPRHVQMAIGGAWIVACLIIGFMDDQIAALIPWAGDMRMYVAVGAVTVVYYTMRMVAHRILTNARVTQAQAPSTDTSIDIWDDHFDVRLDDNTSTYAWGQLSDIGIEGEGLTWYMISGSMLYIPQRAFADRRDMLDFNIQVDDILREIDEKE